MKHDSKQITVLPLRWVRKKIEGMLGDHIVEYGYVGKWAVFRIGWSVFANSHVLECFLPGLKSELGDMPIPDAKEKAIAVLDAWLVGLSKET